MKRRLLAVLLAVAMLASSFVALPVFAAAASENLGSIDVPLNRDSQVDFSKGYTGEVVVSFDLTMSTGTGNVRIWLPIQGNDRLGTANPMLQITEGGGVYAQGATSVGSITPGTTASFVWTYDTVAGTYTVSVNGGEPSAAISCGAQANVGGFAYKVINEKTATIANLTVAGDDGVVELPDLPMNDGARTYHAFDQAYTGIVTIDFDLNIGAGSRFNMWLQSTGKAGYENETGTPWLQFVAEGDLYLQDATKVGKINHGEDNHFQVVVNLATKTFTVAINGGEPCAAHAFTGTMADIAGFDYRMQNTNGYIDNLVVSAVAAPVEPEEPEVPEVPFDNKVSASLSGEETVIYPDDVTFDVVLSKVVGLNVLALGFEYDPAVLTFKDIVLEQEGLEEIIPLNVNEVDGKISVVYGIKNEAITADDDTVWATLVFESVEPTEDEDVTATVDFTHFTASGVVNNGENAVQFDAEILVDSVTTVVTLEEEISFDVNKDGKIDLADLSLVMFNFNSSNAPACDVVPDGIVDVSDVVAMVSAIRTENPDLLPPVVA